MARPLNPFADEDGGDAGRAILPPSAGGLVADGGWPGPAPAVDPDPPAAAGAARPATLAATPPSAADRAFELAALNPLVGAAAPLLWLAARLGETAPVEDVPLVRSRVVEEIERFATAALARGIPPRAIGVARYALCATIDDVVMNTDWGEASDWPMRGLVIGFYRESWGGERFFDLLDQLHATPDEAVDGLELMAVCLAVGFVGKFRVVEGGSTQLARLRAELYRTIRRVRGPHERALSPDFAPLAAPYAVPIRTGWLWATAGGTVAALLALYLVLGLMLSRQVDAAADRVAGLVPTLSAQGWGAPARPAPGRDAPP